MGLNFGVTGLFKDALITTESKFWNSSGLAFINADSYSDGVAQLEGNDTMYGEVNLPDKVSLTRVTAYGKRVDGSGNIVFKLYRKPINTFIGSGNGEEELASFTLNFDSGGSNFSNLNVDEIDNEVYVYYMRVQVGASTTGQISGVKIDFTA